MHPELAPPRPYPRRRVQLASLLLLHGILGMSSATAWLVLHDVPLSPLRIGLGSVATLLLPGYALSRVLFGVGRVQIAERLLLSVSLSILICMAVTFLLHWWPTGITPYGWARALWLAVALCSVLASLRSILPPAREPPLLPVGAAATGLLPVRPRWYGPMQIGVAILAAGLLLSTISFGIRSAQQQPYPGFTQLWVLPDRADPARFEIGIGNFEGTELGYRLEVYANDQVHARWSQLVVPDSATLTTTLRLREPLAYNEYLTVVVYRQDAPTQAYRQVRLWRNAFQESDT